MTVPSRTLQLIRLQLLGLHGSTLLRRVEPRALQLRQWTRSVHAPIKRAPNK